MTGVSAMMAAGVFNARTTNLPQWTLITSNDATAQSISSVYSLSAKSDQSVLVISTVTYGNEYKLFSSTDNGATWANPYTIPAAMNFIRKVIWTGNSFVGFGTAGNTVVTSPDGINWTQSANVGVTFSTMATETLVNNKICISAPGYTSYIWNSSQSNPTGLYTRSTSTFPITQKGVVYSPIRNLYLTKESGFVPISSYYDGTYTSTDLLTWTKTQANFQYSYFYNMDAKSLVYHPNSDKFYFSGPFNSIWSTVDGTSWTKVRGNHWLNVSFNWLANNTTGGIPARIPFNGFNTDSGGGCFRYISSTNKYFFAVGSLSGGGPIYKNIQASDVTDVSTWSKMTNPTSGTAYDVAYSPTLSRYVAIADVSVDYSSNLTSWTTSTTGLTAPGIGVSRLIWAGNQFVGVGSPANNSTSITTSQAAVTSPDGITWTRRAVPGTATLVGTYHKYLVDVAYGNGTYVAVGGMNYSNPPGLTNGAVVATSTDGATWTARQEGTFTNNYSYFQRNDGTYIHPNNLLGVVFTGTAFIAVGSYGLIVTSSDNGATWTNRSDTSAIFEREYSRPTLSGIAIGNGIVVAVGYQTSPSVIITSTDHGATWTRQTVTFGGNLTHILFDGTKFVASGYFGIIVTSTDGINWTVVSHGGTLNELAVLPDGQLMAFGDGGQILTSNDGTTWDELSNASKKTYYNINTGLVAVSNNQITAIVKTYSNTASTVLSTIIRN